jgi:hypothetical protein
VDKTNDIILGVLGTMWERTRPQGVGVYLESIKRSGFKGRKIMLVWDIHPETRRLLLEYGFELVDLPNQSEAFFIARMHVCWDYLKDHYKEFRYIFWLDVKDLVLQSDPSVWMEKRKDKKKIIASNECVNISQEETNQLWALNILGVQKYEEIKDCEVINGGTWAGESEAMTEVFHQVYLGCSTYTGGHPPCQIWINYVLHTMFKDITHIPRWSEGFAACLHPCWSPWRMPCWPNLKDPHPVLDVKKCILHAGTVPDSNNPMVVFNPVWGNNTMVQVATRPIQIETPSMPLSGVECVEKPEGKPFAIVHGYDRDWDMKYMFEFKYRAGADFDLTLFKAWMIDEAKRWEGMMPNRRRGLRRLQRACIVGSSIMPHETRVFRRNP